MRISPKYFLCWIIFAALMLITLFQGSTLSMATSLQPTPTVSPLEDMPQITPVNANQVELIARFGNGWISGNSALSPTGDRLAVSSTIGAGYTIVSHWSRSRCLKAKQVG